MKVVFMGTPEFAVPSLDILYQAGYDIVGVITATDKMGGRGQKTLIESDVKKYAKDKNLNILQPKNLKSPKFNATLKALEADIQIVVAFRMLPEMVWNMPPHGTYNLHGSLLPKYRGAAPINWAIINGDLTTGVTSFKLKHEIDTGSLLYQKEIPIYPFDSAGDLHDRMKWIAAEVVLDTVNAVKDDKLNLKAQDESLVSHAPKLNSENTKIDFNKTSKEVYDHIRGLNPYPGAWMKINGKKTKVYEADYEKTSIDVTPGIIKSDNKTYIHIGTKDGLIKIKTLKVSGKKKMLTKELLNGYKIMED